MHSDCNHRRDCDYAYGQDDPHTFAQGTQVSEPVVVDARVANEKSENIE